MKGVDLRTVQELMGLKTITMTLRYSHLSPAHQLEAVQRLNRPEVPPVSWILPLGERGFPPSSLRAYRSYEVQTIRLGVELERAVCEDESP